MLVATRSLSSAWLLSDTLVLWIFDPLIIGGRFFMLSGVAANFSTCFLFLTKYGSELVSMARIMGSRVFVYIYGTR